MSAEGDHERVTPAARTSLRPRLSARRFRGGAAPGPDPTEALETGVAVAAGLREPAGSAAATEALRRLAGLCGAEAAGLVRPGLPDSWWGPGRAD
ncbi:hypothetical protein ABT341_27065, partial [Pseudonocardia alni]